MVDFMLWFLESSLLILFVLGILGSDFIVTSGISDWAIKFKTWCRSEYVIIDIQGK